MLYANLLYIRLEAYLDRKTWSGPGGRILASHAGVENIHRLQPSLAGAAGGEAATGGETIRVGKSWGPLWEACRMVLYTEAGQDQGIVCVFRRMGRNGSYASQVRKRTLPRSASIAGFRIQNSSCAKIMCQLKKEYFGALQRWSLEKPLGTGVTACVSMSNQNRVSDNPPSLLKRFWIFSMTILIKTWVLFPLFGERLLFFFFNKLVSAELCHWNILRNADF